MSGEWGGGAGAERYSQLLRLSRMKLFWGAQGAGGLQGGGDTVRPPQYSPPPP